MWLEQQVTGRAYTSQGMPGRKGKEARVPVVAVKISIPICD